MRKKFAALLTAILCMTGSVCAVPANAADVTVNPYYTIDTETFTYTSQPSGFILESEVCEPDFLVVGIAYCEDDPDKIGNYLVTPIERPGSDMHGGGVGWLCPSAIQALGGIELHVGDLLKFDGGYGMAEITPPIYCPYPDDDPYLEPTTVIYLGNGADLFGKEFERVIRMQMVIEGINLAKRWTGNSIYGISIKWGDVDADYDISILDCISLNKNLLGGLELCDYAKIVSDVNNDGILDSTDSLAILKEVVGLTVNYEPAVD